MSIESYVSLYYRQKKKQLAAKPRASLQATPSVVGWQCKIADKHLKEFIVWQNHIEHQYIFHYTKTCFIEPKEGWALTNDRHVIWHSVPNSLTKWSKAYPPFPFGWDFSKKKIKYFPKLISLNYLYRGGNNYWHFFNDILGQLALLHQHNINLDIPILIHSKIAQTTFFDQIQAISPFLASRKWIVQTNFVAKTDEVYFAKNLPYLHNHFKQILTWLQLPDYKRDTTKIFLTRNPKTKRSISNWHEIYQMVEQQGFTIVDTDGRSLYQQIELFRNAEQVIAVHGAGVTNLMFRGDAPLQFLEILPADYITPCFYLFACDFGYTYQAFVADGQINNQFYVNTEALVQKIKKTFSKNQ